ncbi:MAG: apolipoprotein N-acyltransferase [Bacteroidales bacterium]|nr:apolipoprotein N-acyltransferase [Bacteroidales bacterium]
MRKTNRKLFVLALLFALLMGIPFLVPHTGFLALAGLVPLLLMELVADAGKVKHFFLWHYLAFVMWNALTTFWVCNATLGGGVAAILLNALQMSLIFALYRGSKKFLSTPLAYIFLAVTWIAWERIYMNVQISWPWLTLGNAFARSVDLVQWYEYTGTLGGSLWIWLSNLWIFYILLLLFSGHVFEMKKIKTAVVIMVAVLLIGGPVAASYEVSRNLDVRDGGRGTLEVTVVQPSFDPYQKFQHLSQSQQNAIFKDMAERSLAGRLCSESRPMLLMAPETFTNDIVIGRENESPTWQSLCALVSDKPGVNVLFGASSTEFSPPSPEAPSALAVQLLDGRWYRSHNSALMLDRTGRTEIFHKSKLVVAVESLPYPKVFLPIDEKLGGVMGRCEGQDEITLLNVNTYDSTGVASRIPLGCAVCYESVYGDYCRDYVRKGAQALAVITNDAWWGNTPGYHQHLSYASLRAIELRRDVARCANTGISAIIDCRGHIVKSSEWWEPQVLQGSVGLYDGQTFFVRYGDLTGRMCCLCFLIMLAVIIVGRFTVRRG